MFIAANNKELTRSVGAACSAQYMALLTERKLVLENSSYKHVAAPQQNRI
jgi:hypothetical protein